MAQRQAPLAVAADADDLLPRRSANLPGDQIDAKAVLHDALEPIWNDIPESDLKRLRGRIEVVLASAQGSLVMDRT